MQNTSWETLGWKKHKLESRLLGEIAITSDMQMTPPLWQKVRRTEVPLDESERGEWKSWLKAQHSESQGHGIWPHHFMANRWGKTVETVANFNFGWSKITTDGDWNHEIRRPLLLGSKVMSNLDSMLKSRDITLSTKFHLVKAMDVSWTIKKAECWRIDAFELWFLRILFRSLGLQGDPTTLY